jgi:hypothetical protein
MVSSRRRAGEEMERVYIKKEMKRVSNLVCLQSKNM